MELNDRMDDRASSFGLDRRDLNLYLARSAYRRAFRAELAS